ncbi:hypothetical protein SAMN05443575_1468 [Jatrophihabitans endophyticus]|uniref:Uncharacterized protein n=1 Tax=Jatrophihabitans endophyticus TaxID=1206085 RepID=A0A1M5HC31_9ACTN|nr:hypothetical protein [Jatrophihabitans endophyticus]SHG13471.1 hypothetical protein SAMN05443575_1468 [Jatrophihabitans endophyticus]
MAIKRPPATISLAGWAKSEGLHFNTGYRRYKKQTLGLETVRVGPRIYVRLDGEGGRPIPLPPPVEEEAEDSRS